MTYKKTFDNTIPFGNKKFQEILDFFLFCCPVEGASFRCVPFSKYGWSGKTQFAQLRKNMLTSASSSLKSNYYPCKKEELQNKFLTVEKVSPVDEYCVFLKNEEGTVMQSLFSAIRNAFAHGSFSIREYRCDGKKIKVYFLSNYKNYLKAEIVLQENTLLEWIRIVKQGYTA